MNTQIFHLIKYDLNGHLMSQNVPFMFILTLTYVLMDNLLSLFIYESVYERGRKKKISDGTTTFDPFYIILAEKVICNFI